MSSMLEQAIIDADQLKETAKKTAEETVVEKYQHEIKEAVEKILEQDEVVETEMGVDEEGNLAVVEDLPAAQTADMEEVVEIDLSKLEELMADEMEEGLLDAGDMSSREQVAEELDALAEDDEVELNESDLLELAGEEEMEINEADLAAVIAEMLEEDFVSDSTKEEEAEAGEEEAEKSGGQPGAVYKGVAENVEEEEEEELDKPYKRTKKTGGQQYGGGGDYDYKSRDIQLQENKNNTLLREQTKLNKKVQLLEGKLNNYGTVIKKLKNKLNESNLTNAKLLYQNRILNSVSLNERQRDKIVEAISNATTVEEAKLIFETLQSAVGSFKKNKAPKSLREVVSRSSSAFIPRKEAQPRVDNFAERMRTLAGLK